MLNVREASSNDAEGIRDLFLAAYGKTYPYQQFYELHFIKKICFSDNNLVLVCEDKNKNIIATASVIMDVGAYTDLIGEFGRLIVHPDARGQGAGKLLMEKRIEFVKKQLHVGIVEARAIHPFAQKISKLYKFKIVGFLPQKHILKERESVAHLVQYFDNSLQLRKYSPQIIPQIYPIAKIALSNVGIKFDAIVNEKVAPYPYNNHYQIKELNNHEYPSLLRIQRGRLKNREIFGPLRLHYGFSRLNAKNAQYLIAIDNHSIVGAIGFTNSKAEKNVKIFEIIAIHDDSIRFLLTKFHENLQKMQTEYIEIDVSAYAPRMQKTLIEMGYLPASYIPAFAFDDTFRLDIIRMVRLGVPFDVRKVNLIPAVQEISEIVIREFKKQNLSVNIGEGMRSVPFLQGLSEEQMQRLALISSTVEYNKNEVIFSENETSMQLHIVLNGKINVFKQDKKIGIIKQFESLGEVSLALCNDKHTATAIAVEEVKAIVFDFKDLIELANVRPDIALIMYQNLAKGLANKLQRVNDSIGKR